ncbi:hypothetical protein ACJRO7_020136 [Eucalyptus globulus]|uniref:Cytochrome P450 n=1 Tax=Eucalyptus globulus TaxID=34317 RepID=A0ABD3KFN1_EUCGL
MNIVSAMLYSTALILSLCSSKHVPVRGTAFAQLIYFNQLYDYVTGVGRRSPTFCLLTLDGSETHTTDVRNIEHILKTNFDKYTKDKYNIDIMKDLLGEGIFVVDGEKWKKQRKVASSEFATRVLRDFSCCVFRKNAAKLVKVLEELSAASEGFDMQDILMRCTLDSIFKVGFSVELNCLEGSSKEGRAFIKALLSIDSKARLRNNITLIDNFMHQNDKEDILSRILLESEKDPENMNDKYLRDIILNFMIQKIAEEIKEGMGDQTSEANSDWFVKRITDPNGKCAETDDVLPDGFHVKKGDGIYYWAYSMGRMRNIWGEDAEDFKPERWLKDGIFQKRITFQICCIQCLFAGPGICLGKDFAYRQMKIVPIALLCFLCFRLADETRPVTYKVMFTLHNDNGLHLRAVPRLAM